MVLMVAAAGRKKEEEDNLHGERTCGCCGWTVDVLASCGGDGGLKANGDDSGGLDDGERESVKRQTTEKKKFWGGRLIFWLSLDLNFSTPEHEDKIYL